MEKLVVLSQINERLGRIEAETSSIKEKLSSFEKSLTSLNQEVEELQVPALPAKLTTQVSKISKTPLKTL